MTSKFVLMAAAGLSCPLVVLVAIDRAAVAVGLALKLRALPAGKRPFRFILKFIRLKPPLASFHMPGLAAREFPALYALADSSLLVSLPVIQARRPVLGMGWRGERKRKHERSRRK